MRKKILTLSLVFSGVLLFTLIGLLISVFKNLNTDNSIIPSIFLMITATFGIYYLLDGCKKGEAAKFYVCFMGAIGVCDLLAIYRASDYPGIGTVLMALCIACYGLLCFAKDLGQKKSYIFSITALACKTVIMIVTFVKIGGFSMQVCSSFILAVTSLFMVYAKYFDKALRGSK